MTDGPSAAQVTGGAPSGFPRIYYVSPGWRVLLCALSALLLAGALAAIVFGAILHDGATAQAKAIIMAIGIGLAAASIYAFVATLMSRVVLYADTVEMVGLVRRRRARRADIVGRRFHAMPYNLPPTLVLTTNNGKNLNISGFMSGDAVFRRMGCLHSRPRCEGCTGHAGRDRRRRTAGAHPRRTVEAHRSSPARSQERSTSAATLCACGRFFIPAPTPWPSRP